MGARVRRWSVGVFATAAIMLAWQPGAAQAHPQFLGKWLALTPPGGYMAFTFGPGFHLGNGVWRGPYTFTVSNVPAGAGEYELRMFNGTEGTLILRGTQFNAGSNVGNVDLGCQTVVFMNVAYRR